MNHWGFPDPPVGWFIEEIIIPIGRFKIPPREIEEALPQQMLMLQVAGQAIADADLSRVDRLRTGVFIGVELDLNTTNYHLRWALRSRAADWAERLGRPTEGEVFDRWVDALCDSLAPALNANRTIGGLGSIAASRIAREFGLGGASYVMSSEETSGLSALQAASRALLQGRIDCAVVGAVDLAGDVRSLITLESADGLAQAGDSPPFGPASAGVVPSDAAVAFVLKRTEDAHRDGDRVYAVVKGMGTAAGEPLPVPSGSAVSGFPDSSPTLGAAIRRSCDEAGITPAEIPYVAAHGSGNTHRDRAEMAALSAAFGPDALLGCAKKSVGHTGAAAGLISVLGATLSLYRQVLPPAPGVRERATPWVRDRIEGPRRTGVLAVSRGVSCAHVILEEAEAAASTTAEAAASTTAASAPASLRSRGAPRLKEGLFVIEGDNRGDLVGGLLELLESANETARPAAIDALAKVWYEDHPSRPDASLCIALIARHTDEVKALARSAADQFERGDDPSDRSAGRVFFSRDPLGPDGGLAFVYPGSGSQYTGMGREIGLQWPEILRAQDLANERLKSQLRAAEIWGDTAGDTDARTVILSQVALGTITTDLMAGFGVRPDAVVGYSLGETAGLFSLGAWHERDEMLRRVTDSALFISELTGRCSAARRTWGLAEDEEVEWSVGVVETPAERVTEVLANLDRAYLLIINTPDECVIGGDARAVRRAVDLLECPFHALEGVTTVHCEVAAEVAEEYRNLHVLDTNPPEGVRFYSGAWGESYELDRERAADSLLAQAIQGVDFPKTVRRAHADGVRIFLEMGPGGSCTRMIHKILGDVPFRARSISSSTQDEPSAVLRALGMLASERVPVNLTQLYPESAVIEDESGPMIRIPVGQAGFGAMPVDSARPVVHETDSRSFMRNPKEHPIDAGVFSRDPRLLTSNPEISPSNPVGVVSNPAGNAANPMGGVANSIGDPATPIGDPADFSPGLSAAVRAAETTIQAHEAFLRASQRTQELAEREYARQQALVRALMADRTAFAVGGPAVVGEPPIGSPASSTPSAPPITMDRDRLMEFAIGSIGRALGDRFAQVDEHPTRVRLPDEPLMLVDRVTHIEAEPQSMTSGRIVTEHDVLEGGWYLDGGRLPTCIAVEAGQADLLLSGYLGVDTETRGLAVYRLLDAVVTFHSELPRPGQIIQYDIHILGFFRQGDTWLFRFQFDAYVNGQPLLTMREGVAGFFTQSELDAGKGIVRIGIDQQKQAGRRPDGWQELVPMSGDPFDEDRLEALRAGDLVGAFGEDFSGLPVTRPLTIPGERMRLVHRVMDLAPEGGRYGVGCIVAEADIHPDDWFLTCHFSDDQVMPGTLMYECCLHTLRIYLLRMGWIAPADRATWQPVIDVRSRLRCRGQVLASTKTVTYEIHLRELGYRPEPYAVADALMYADGKPIVEIRDMSVQLTGTDRQTLEAMWAGRHILKSADGGTASSGTASSEVARSGVARSGVARGGTAHGGTAHGGTTGTKPLYDKKSILAFSSGKPSEAYGAPYRVFDEGKRRIARLPRPPYQFLDRISAVEGEPFVMQAGASATAHFDVSPDHWYFDGNRQREMPFAVLLEVALQPCGWLAAYVGSALTSEENLRFRNLGGDAIQLARITAADDVITTRVDLTSVSASGGMIIQHYSLALESERLGPLYAGTTYFGFFSKQALEDQVGMRDVHIHEPTPDELERGRSLVMPHTAPFPDPRLRMVDRIELLVADGGVDGLGWVHGSIAVDPSAWFFEAHFYQDPVWPGSLGLEAFVQLLKVYAVDRWKLGEGTEFATMAAGRTATGKDPGGEADGGGRHRWTYRGQIIPGCRRVDVFASITDVDDAEKRLRADGFLTVDGRTIYAMNDFSLEVIA